MVCVFKDGWNNRGCDEETNPEEFGSVLIKYSVAKAYNKRKQNENENVKENEYDGNASLVGLLCGRRENRRTAEVRIRKISIGKQHAKSACISERSEAFSQCCPREIFPERLRCDLIFWLLFDQAKSSINYNKRKKNENGQENEYGRDADLKRFRLFNQAKNNAGIQSSKVRMKI